MIALPECAQAEPIVKWVGGKRQLAAVISNAAYAWLTKTGGRYFEPFLGGGAVALELRFPAMVLNDLCAPLIHTYEYARRYPGSVAWMFNLYRQRGVDETTYYAIRSQRPRSHVQRAARFLYLNGLCFNGLYRENAKGEFNVSYGGTGPQVDALGVLPKRIAAFSAAFATAELRCVDFREIIAQTQKGDFIFADPPYDGSFSNYLKEGFDAQDQAVLAEALRAAHQRGVGILITNAGTEHVRRLYAWTNLFKTGENRRVNAQSGRRGRVNCVLGTTVVLGGS